MTQPQVLMQTTALRQPLSLALTQAHPASVAIAAFFAMGCLCLGHTTVAHAQDRAEIDKTRITGNRELPKVLYIVPWKKPEPGELAARPPKSVLDEVLAPLDRDVVRREQQYGAMARSRTEPAAADKP